MNPDIDTDLGMDGGSERRHEEREGKQ